VILLAFALAIGSLTVHRIRSDFNRQVSDTARELPRQLQITIEPFRIVPPLADFTANRAVVKVMSLDQRVLEQEPKGAPYLGPPTVAVRTIKGYRVVNTEVSLRLASTGEPLGHVIIQYARPVAPTEATVKRVELFLLVGVLAGSVLALIAGMAIARRAMAPIANLTSTAAEIARTRDPSRRMPEPLADDEVAELTRTLEGMLRELDAARGETETLLARQRRFVADASH
jgi:two-component system OmpR family sensor kinase